jgi:hypothetical protein
MLGQAVMLIIMSAWHEFLGDEVKVRVERVDVERRQIDLGLVRKET